MYCALIFPTSFFYSFFNNSSHIQRIFLEVGSVDELFSKHQFGQLGGGGGDIVEKGVT